MKKFNVLFMALLCASVVFVGCSDDEDENGGNGQGAGNGGSGVVVLPKKVVKVIRSFSDYSGKDTTLYAYDAEGRLSKITEFRGSNGDDVTNIVYASNKITLTDNNSDNYSTETIELRDGRAIRTVDSSSSGNFRNERTYIYSGNYISKIIEEYTEIYNGETTTDTYTFSVKEGNLVKLDDGADDVVDIEVGSIDNNMNIDLMYGDIGDFGDYATLLCVMGDRFKKLPTKDTWTDSGDYEDVDTYKYEVNKDGYVTKITVTNNDGDTTVYDITYE